MYEIPDERENGVFYDFIQNDRAYHIYQNGFYHVFANHPCEHDALQSFLLSLLL
jgi:hypothetical protein